MFLDREGLSPDIALYYAKSSRGICGTSRHRVAMDAPLSALSLFLPLFSFPSGMSLELPRKNFYSPSRREITPRTKYCRATRFLFYAVLGRFTAVAQPLFESYGYFATRRRDISRGKGLSFGRRETTLPLRAKCIAFGGARILFLRENERIRRSRRFPRLGTRFTDEFVLNSMHMADKRKIPRYSVYYRGTVIKTFSQ